MSRGLGALQRWLLLNLPPHCERPCPVAGTMLTPAQLAARYYQSNQPTVAQVNTVRRALLRLQEQHLARTYLILDVDQDVCLGNRARACDSL
jgi:hypothetical protein